MSRYPWRDTSSDIAGGQPPQWETPGGAQAKANKAEEESKKYTDEKNADFTSHVQNTTIHVTQSDKDNWNSKAPSVHTHANATPTTPGFESAADKAKLDGIEEKANNYVHPTTHPPSIIAQDVSNRFVTDAEKAAWNAKAETTTATPDAKGLMAAADKTKLDGIASGAEVNQNAFSTIKAPGQADVNAGSKQETINFTGGTGITVTTDPAAKKVMITATGEATPGPHAASHVTGGTDIIPDAVVNGSSGLMSGADAEFVRNTGETKTGAQAKADGAEAAAKSYTDTRITELGKEVTDAAAVAAAAIPAVQKGAASGVATLDKDSKVPAAQLPISTATNNTSQTQVASTSAVKAAYDLATSKLDKNTAFIELRDGATTAGPAFIDFHTGSQFIDFDSRIIAEGGNGNVGGGKLSINASEVNLGGTTKVFGSANATEFSSSSTVPFTAIGSGHYSWVFHTPNGDGKFLYISPSNTKGGADWNFNQGVRIEAQDIYVAGVGLRAAVEHLYSGGGSPEGAVSAPVGSLYRRLDGYAGETLYIKESGTGNTGWRAVK